MFPACENSDTGAGKPSTRRRCRLQPRMVTTVDDLDQDPAGPGLGCHEPGSRRNPVRDRIRSGRSRQPDPASPILMPTRLPGRAAPRPFRPASPFPTDKCPDSPDNRPPYPPHTPPPHTYTLHPEIQSRFRIFIHGPPPWVPGVGTWFRKLSCRWRTGRDPSATIPWHPSPYGAPTPHRHPAAEEARSSPENSLTVGLDSIILPPHFPTSWIIITHPRVDSRHPNCAASFHAVVGTNVGVALRGARDTLPCGRLR